MKPSVRLGALSKLKVFYVFTHDSVGVGEDGPLTNPSNNSPASCHSWPERIPSCRRQRNRHVLGRRDRTLWPTLFAFTRQNVPHLSRDRATGGVSKGGYILSESEGGAPDVILIGSGSEVSLCVKAQEKLKGYGVKARVVSLPSWYLFEAQDAAYQESVLPKAIKKRVTVEAGSSFGWHRWAGDDGTIIAIDHFGASAPGDTIMKNFGFTAEHVTSAALRQLGQRPPMPTKNTAATPPTSPPLPPRRATPNALPPQTLRARP